MVRMDRIRYGFTNQTRRVARSRVEKTYLGAGRFERAGAEHACLVHLRGVLPVPEVLDVEEGVPRLVTAGIAGEHGQDLIEAGRAGEVLYLLGMFLRELQALGTAAVPGLVGTGSVIVHGDFGPQNALVDRHRMAVVLDWEFAHLGLPIEDLAWAEWIVRMHHPDASPELDELHRGAQLQPGWPARHEAMLARCRQLILFCERNRQRPGVQLWDGRLRATERWIE
jgi:hypothetical protein